MLYFVCFFKKLILEEVASFRKEVRGISTGTSTTQKSSTMKPVPAEKQGAQKTTSEGTKSQINQQGQRISNQKTAQPHKTSHSATRVLKQGVSTKTTTEAMPEPIPGKRSGTAAAAAAWRNKTPSPHSRDPPEQFQTFPPKSPARGTLAASNVVKEVNNAYEENWRRKEADRIKTEEEAKRREMLQKKLQEDEEERLKLVHLKAMELKAKEEAERLRQREEVENLAIQERLRHRKQLEADQKAQSEREAKERDAQELEEAENMKAHLLLEKQIKEEKEALARAELRIEAARLERMKVQEEEERMRILQEEKEQECEEEERRSKIMASSVSNQHKLQNQNETSARERLVRQYEMDGKQRGEVGSQGPSGGGLYGRDSMHTTYGRRDSSNTTSKAGYRRDTSSTNNASKAGYMRDTSSTRGPTGSMPPPPRVNNDQPPVRPKAPMKEDHARPAVPLGDKKPTATGQRARKLTVPKSPNFSTMSWQRSRGGGDRPVPDNGFAPGGGTSTFRKPVTTRTNTAAHVRGTTRNTKGTARF